MYYVNLLLFRWEAGMLKDIIFVFLMEILNTKEECSFVMISSDRSGQWWSPTTKREVNEIWDSLQAGEVPKSRYGMRVGVCLTDTRKYHKLAENGCLEEELPIFLLSYVLKICKANGLVLQKASDGKKFVLESEYPMEVKIPPIGGFNQKKNFGQASSF